MKKLLKQVWKDFNDDDFMGSLSIAMFVALLIIWMVITPW